MSTLKPIPIFARAPVKLCPICGEPSYSRDAIHPQCAVQQADEPRNVRLRKKKKEQSQAGKLRQKSWEKKCPKCKAQVHVRRGQCGCGHKF